MSRACKVTIKPSLTIGRIPTVVESIIPKLMDGDNVVLESESIVNDKKKFYSTRLSLVNVLIPIVRKIKRDNIETTLAFQLSESGKLKIYAVSSENDTIPADDEEW